jgi:hypothetical protein
MSNPKLRGAILVIVIFVTAAVVGSQSKTDMPSSVSPDQWVVLGDRAGIALTDRPSKAGGRLTSEVRGQLWVKVHGQWLPAQLEQPRSMVPAS